MKRKKTPVALITVLVLAVGGLAIASKQFSFYNLSAEEQNRQRQEEYMKEQEAKAGQSKPAPTDASKEEAEMKARLKSSATAKPAVPQEERIGRPPSIVSQQQQVYKPKQNDSSTSSQWFDK